MPLNSIILRISFNLVIWHILDNNLLFFFMIILIIFLLRDNLVLPMRIPLVWAKVLVLVRVIIVTCSLGGILILVRLLLLINTTLVILNILILTKCWHPLVLKLLLRVDIVLHFDLIWVAMLWLIHSWELQDDHSYSIFEPCVVKVRACFFHDPRQIRHFFLSLLHLPFYFALLFVP